MNQFTAGKVMTKIKRVNFLLRHSEYTNQRDNSHGAVIPSNPKSPHFFQKSCTYTLSTGLQI